MQSLALFRNIAAHIFHCEQAVVSFEIVHYQARGLAFIEFIWPMLLQTRERRREIGLHERFAFVVELAVI